MLPASLHIAQQQYVKINTAFHFTTLDKKRRIGNEFWVALSVDIPELKEDSSTILINYTLNRKTDTRWLTEMTHEGRVYISKSDYDFTLKVAKELEGKEPNQRNLKSNQSK